MGVNSREDVSRGQGVDKDTEGMCGRHKAAPPCDTTTLLHSYRGLCASCPRPAPSWPVSAGSPQALAPNHLSSCCVLCCLISSPLSLASSSLAAAGCQEIQRRGKWLLWLMAVGRQVGVTVLVKALGPRHICHVWAWKLAPSSQCSLAMTCSGQMSEVGGWGGFTEMTVCQVVLLGEARVVSASPALLSPPPILG